MYANLLIWIGVLERLGGIFTGLAVLFFFLAAIAVIYYLTRLTGADEIRTFEDVTDTPEAAKKLKAVAKRRAWVTPILFVLFVILAQMPSRTEIVTFFVAAEVDKYNVKVTDSSLSPENLVGVVDNTVKSLDDIISEVKNLLTPETAETKK